MKGEEFSSICIDKGIGVLRSLTRSRLFMRVHAATFEESLKKLYIYMENPSQISFEDEILMIIRSFIVRTQSITPVMWELFTKFPAILEKNKHQFKELFDTINMYLITGREGFIQNQDMLKVVVQMAATALQTTNPTQSVNNSEGAILL